MKLYSGSGKTLGASPGADLPTYVYPSALKAVIKAGYLDVVKDWIETKGNGLFAWRHSC